MAKANSFCLMGVPTRVAFKKAIDMAMDSIPSLMVTRTKVSTKITFAMEEVTSIKNQLEINTLANGVKVNRTGEVPSVLVVDNGKVLYMMENTQKV